MVKRATKRTKKHSVGNRLLSIPTYLGNDKIPTTVSLVQYGSKQVLVKNMQSHSELKKEIVANKVNWFKVTGICDADYISKICKEFGLHSFDVKDLLADQKIVKVVLYDDITFVLMSGFYLKNDDTLDDMQIAFIVGNNFIVSFQESDTPIFDEVSKAIEENNILFRENGTDFLLYILFNSVNIFNTNTVLSMEDALTDVEDRLINQKNTVDIQHFLRMRRIDYTHMKRFVVSFREEFTNLLHNTNKLIKPENMVYFNDYDDRLRTTLGNLDALHESLISLLDVYYNNNNLKMNEIIKRLTIVSTIFIPLTFMVGVWGMNFDVMPELEWKYGYLFSWLTFIVIVLLACYLMKKKKGF